MFTHKLTVFAQICGYLQLPAILDIKKVNSRRHSSCALLILIIMYARIEHQLCCYFRGFFFAD